MITLSLSSVPYSFKVSLGLGPSLPAKETLGIQEYRVGKQAGLT